MNVIRSSVIILVGLILTTFVLNFAANYIESTPSPVDQKFAVVDTYKGCDVVRYNPDHSARYFYFLDCNK